MNFYFYDRFRKGKKTAGCPRNSYIVQIQCDVRVKTFKEFKENDEQPERNMSWNCESNIRVEKKKIFTFISIMNLYLIYFAYYTFSRSV